MRLVTPDNSTLHGQVAYSTPNRTLIPQQTEQGFHSNDDGHFHRHCHPAKFLPLSCHGRLQGRYRVRFLKLVANRIAPEPRKAFSSTGNSLSAQGCTVEWSTEIPRSAIICSRWRRLNGYATYLRTQRRITSSGWCRRLSTFATAGFRFGFIDQIVPRRGLSIAGSLLRQSPRSLWQSLCRDCQTSPV